MELDKPIDKPYCLKSLLEYRMQGKTYQNIADIYGKTKQAIHQQIKGIYDLIDKNSLDAYKANKTNLLNGIESALLEQTVNPIKLKAMSVRDAAVSFGIIYDKGRLEQGLSTENIAVKDASAELIEKQAQAAKHLEELRKKLL